MTALIKERLKGVLVLTVFMATPLLAQLGPKDQFKFPKLNAIKMPETHEVTLNNGMTLYLVEARDYPTIDIRALIRTGSVYEDTDKIGLAGLTGMVMRTGGSQKYPGDELDALLETLAATVETSIGSTSGSASVSVLKEDIDKGLDVLASLLMQPAFPQEKIDLAKTQAKSAIARRNDDVGGIASREFDKLIYGASSPYARHPEYATIDAISREDMLAFHKAYFHPNNVALAVWGDFDWKAMKQKIDVAFSGWQPGPKAPANPPGVDYSFDSSVNYVEKTDVNQSNIIMGHLGGTMDNPDYPALLVMNQILSYDRLFKRVRTDEGLAYSVYGFYDAGLKVPGTFMCGCQTKSESTVKAISIIKEEIRTMQNSLVTDQELKKAKNGYLNSFVFNFQSKGQIINRALHLAYAGYPDDFLMSLKERVEKVSRDDVKRVAAEYLKPDMMRILVVGKAADFDQPLSVLGTVNTIDITIPVPQAAAVAKADDASLKAGVAVWRKMHEALGGKALAGINSIKEAGEVSMMGMNLKSENIIDYPDRMRMTIETPMGQVEVVATPQAAWQVIPGQGTADMPAAKVRESQETLLRDFIHLAASDEGKTIQLLGKEEKEGASLIHLLVTENGYSYHLFVDGSTYRPWGLSYTGETPQGPGELIEQYSEYQKFGEIWMPALTQTLFQGQPVAKAKRLSVEFNIELDEALFSK